MAVRTEVFEAKIKFTTTGLYGSQRGAIANLERLAEAAQNATNKLGELGSINLNFRRATTQLDKLKTRIDELDFDIGPGGGLSDNTIAQVSKFATVFADSLDDIKSTSDIRMEEVAAIMGTTVDKIVALFGRLKRENRGLFDSLVDSSQSAADEIVFRSIIPDMVTAIRKELAKISPAFAVEADVVTREFEELQDKLSEIKVKDFLGSLIDTTTEFKRVALETRIDANKAFGSIEKDIRNLDDATGSWAGDFGKDYETRVRPALDDIQVAMNQVRNAAVRAGIFSDSPTKIDASRSVIASASQKASLTIADLRKEIDVLATQAEVSGMGEFANDLRDTFERTSRAAQATVQWQDQFDQLGVEIKDVRRNLAGYHVEINNIDLALSKVSGLDAHAFSGISQQLKTLKDNVTSALQLDENYDPIHNYQLLEKLEDRLRLVGESSGRMEQDTKDAFEGMLKAVQKFKAELNQFPEAEHAVNRLVSLEREARNLAQISAEFSDIDEVKLFEEEGLKDAYLQIESIQRSIKDRTKPEVIAFHQEVVKLRHEVGQLGKLGAESIHELGDQIGRLSTEGQKLLDADVAEQMQKQLEKVQQRAAQTSEKTASQDAKRQQRIQDITGRIDSLAESTVVTEKRLSRFFSGISTAATTPGLRIQGLREALAGTGASSNLFIRYLDRMTASSSDLEQEQRKLIRSAAEIGKQIADSSSALKDMSNQFRILTQQEFNNVNVSEQFNKELTKLDSSFDTVFRTAQRGGDITRALITAADEVRDVRREYDRVLSQIPESATESRKAFQAMGQELLNYESRLKAISARYQADRNQVEKARQAQENLNAEGEKRVGILGRVIGLIRRQKDAEEDVNEETQKSTSFIRRITVLLGQRNKAEATFGVETKQNIGFLGEFQIKLRKTFGIYQGATNEAKKLTESTQSMGREMQVAAKSAEVFKGALTGALIGSGIGSFIGSLAGTFTGATAALGSFNSEINQASVLAIARTNEIADSSKTFGNIIKQVYIDNFGQTPEQVGEVVSLVGQQMTRLGDVTEEGVVTASENVFRITDAFKETDFNEVVDAARALVKDYGLTWDQAFDFITGGLKRGLNISNDFLDSIREYSPQIKNAGGTAENFFNILETGLQSGSLGTDKAIDLFKEFRARILDGSKATEKALNDIGINSQQFLAQLASGQVTVADAFDIVRERMSEIDNQAVVMQSGFGLMGSMFEDLGQEAALAIKTSGTALEDLQGQTASLDIQYHTIGAALSTIGRNITAALAPANEAFLYLVNAVMPLITGTINTVAPLVQGLSNYFLNLVTSVYETATGIIQGSETIQFALQGLTAFIQAIATGDWYVAWETIKYTIESVIIDAIDYLNQFGVDAFNWGFSFVEQIGSGMISAAQSVINAIVSLTNQIADYLMPGSPPKKGPLSEIDTWGEELVAVFGEGMSSADADFMVDLLEPISEAFREQGVENGAELFNSVRDDLALLLKDIEETGNFNEEVFGRISSSIGDSEVSKELQAQLKARARLAQIQKQINSATSFEEVDRLEKEKKAIEETLGEREKQKRLQEQLDRLAEQAGGPGSDVDQAELPEATAGALGKQEKALKERLTAFEKYKQDVKGIQDKYNSGIIDSEEDYLKQLISAEKRYVDQSLKEGLSVNLEESGQRISEWQARLDEISESAESNSKSTKSSFNELVKSVTALPKSIEDSIAAAPGRIVTSVKEAAVQGSTAFIDTVKSTLQDRISGLGTSLFDALKNVVSGAIDRLVAWAKGFAPGQKLIPSLVVGFFTAPIVYKAFDIFTNLITLTIRFDKTLGALGRVFSFIAKRFLYFSIAGYVVIGLLQNWDKLLDEVVHLFGGLYNAIGETISNLGNLYSALKESEIGQTILKNVVDTISLFTEGIVGIAVLLTKTIKKLLKVAILEPWLLFFEFINTFIEKLGGAEGVLKKIGPAAFAVSTYLRNSAEYFEGAIRAILDGDIVTFFDNLRTSFEWLLQIFKSPSVKKAGDALWQAFVDAFYEKWAELEIKAPGFTQFVEDVVTKVGEVVAKLQTIGTIISDAFADISPEFSNLFTAVASGDIPGLREAASNIASRFGQMLSDVFAEIPTQEIGQGITNLLGKALMLLPEGSIENIQLAIDKINEVRQTIVDAFNLVTTTISQSETFKELTRLLFSIIDAVKELWPEVLILAGYFKIMALVGIAAGTALSGPFLAGAALVAIAIASINDVIVYLDPLLGGLIKTIRGIVEWFTSLFAIVHAIITGNWDQIPSLIGDAVESFYTIISGIVDVATSIAGAVIAAIVGAAEELAVGALHIVSYLFGGDPDQQIATVRQTVDEMLADFNWFITEVQRYFQELPANAAAFTEALLTDPVATITEFTQIAYDEISKFLDFDGLEKQLNKSPLTLINEMLTGVGIDTEPISKAITDVTETWDGFIESLSSINETTISGGAGAIKQAIIDNFTFGEDVFNLPEKIKNFATSLENITSSDDIVERLRGIGSGIIQNIWDGIVFYIDAFFGGDSPEAKEQGPKIAESLEKSVTSDEGKEKTREAGKSLVNNVVIGVLQGIITANEWLRETAGPAIINGLGSALAVAALAGDWIGSLIGSLLSVVSSSVSALADVGIAITEGIIEGIVGLFVSEETASTVADTIGNMLHIATRAIVWPLEIITTGITALLNPVETWEELKTTWSGNADLLVTAVTLVFENSVDAIKTAVGNFIQGGIDKFQEMYDTVVGNSIIPDMVEDIISKIGELPTRAVALIQTFISAITTELSNSAGTVISAVADLFGFGGDETEGESPQDASLSIASIITSIATFPAKLQEMVTLATTAWDVFTLYLWTSWQQSMITIEIAWGVAIAAVQSGIDVTISKFTSLLSSINIIGNTSSDVFSNMKDDAKSAAQKIDEDLVNALRKAITYFEKLEDAARAAASAVNQIGGGNSGAPPLGSYQSGTNYVPQTGVYQLHQGEAVLNPDAADTFRELIKILGVSPNRYNMQGANANGVAVTGNQTKNINVTVNAEYNTPQSESTIRDDVLFALRLAT